MRNAPPERPIWPATMPTDLRLRVLDALCYAGVGPEHIWDEVTEWLEDHHIPVPTWLVQSGNDIITFPGPHDMWAKSQSEVKTMNLTRLIYSSVHSHISDEAINHLLRSSRANNARDGISGALVMTPSRFLQVLEGGRTAIGQCFMRIMRDPRHRDIEVVACRDAESRLFRDWSMHRIDVTSIKSDVVARYAISGEFDPARMSQFAIEDLCRTLSGDGWKAAA